MSLHWCQYLHLKKETKRQYDVSWISEGTSTGSEILILGYGDKYMVAYQSSIEKLLFYLYSSKVIGRQCYMRLTNIF